MEQVYDLYEKTITKYDEASTFNKILQLWIKTDKDLNILDVGCSDGNVTAHLTSQHTVIRVDISEHQLKKARKKGLKTVRCDVNKSLPFKSNVFDIVMLVDIIEHLFEPENALKEVHRILKNNGYIIIQVPNYFSIIGRVRLLRSKSIVTDLHKPFRSWNYFHLRFFSYKDFINFLTITGFEIEKEDFDWIGSGLSEDERLAPFWRIISILLNPISKYLMKRFPNLFSLSFKCRARKIDNNQNNSPEVMLA